MSSKLEGVMAAAEKLTKSVRQTVNAIIDDQSFVELDALIGARDEFGDIKGEGVLCGLATIDGSDIAIFATNPEVFDGGLSKKGAEKISRLIDRAIKAELPLISIIDTSGARIFEGIDALDGYSIVFKAFSAASDCIPTITLVKGKNLGMLSYLATLSDFCIGYEKAEMATVSPLILSAEIGKNIVSANNSAAIGAFTNVVRSDNEAKALIVRALEIFYSKMPTSDDANRVCESLSESSRISDVFSSAFDEGSQQEIRSAFCPEVLTGYARLDGRQVGVVGISGKLTPAGAAKIKDFLVGINSIQGISLVTLIDSDGIAADAKYEQSTKIRDVGSLIYTYCTKSVPSVSLITKRAVGAAYSIFASKAVSDYTMAWDCASITPLESSAAARLIYGKQIAKLKNQAAAEKKFAQKYEDENSALTAAERGYVDMVLLPAHTRQYLIAALTAAKGS